MQHDIEHDIRALAETVRGYFEKDVEEIYDEQWANVLPALEQVEQWLGPAPLQIGAYYTCDSPDQRDEQIRTIFAAHGSDRERIDSGYHFATRERELLAWVPQDQVKACVAALQAAGFRVLTPWAYDDLK
jgi:hypothetical protein